MRRLHTTSLALSAICAFGMTGCGLGDDGPQGTGEPAVNSLDRDLALGATGGDVAAVTQYLRDHGYFPNAKLQASYPAWRPLVPVAPARDDVFDVHTVEATRAFQHAAGLPETGVVDQLTRAQLQQLTCGVPEGIAPSDTSEKWDIGAQAGQSTFTWRVANTDGDLPLATVQSLTTGSLALWAQATGFTFNQVTGSSDILIDFGVLASNVNAQTSGRHITMNSLRNWTNTVPVPATSMHMASILLHELGHAININHSSLDTTIMYPFFNIGQAPKTVRTTDDTLAGVARNTFWTVIGDNGARDLAFNVHPNAGATVWGIAGAAVPGGHQIFRFDTQNWNLMPGGAERVAVNPTSSANIPWVVNNAGGIFVFNFATGIWDVVGGCATDIGIGDDDSVWIIGCTDSPGGKQILKLTASLPCSANCFTVVPGGAVRIAVGPQKPGLQNVPWVVNSAHNIFRRQSGDPNSTLWDVLPGTATDIAAAGGFAYSIGTASSPGGFKIQAWDEQAGGGGGGPPPVAQFKWVTIPGGAVGVTMSASGFPIVVNNAGGSFWAFH